MVADWLVPALSSVVSVIDFVSHGPLTRHARWVGFDAAQELSTVYVELSLSGVYVMFS